MDSAEQSVSGVVAAVHGAMLELRNIRTRATDSVVGEFLLVDAAYAVVRYTLIPNYMPFPVVFF